MKAEAVRNAELTGPAEASGSAVLSDAPPQVDATGVQHDLTDWQARHAMLVLRCVKVGQRHA